MFSKSNQVKVLNDWPQPEAGAPEPRIFADDTNFVLRYFTANNKIAVVVFPMVNIFKFGSPNDEALGGHPLYKNGLKFYSVHEISNSSWVQELEKQNSDHPKHNKENFLRDKKHYIFTFHDSTLECVATEGEFWKPAINVFSSEEEANKMFEEARNT